MRIVGEVFYRRMLILGGKGAEPVAGFAKDEGLEFAPLKRGELDLDEYLRFRPDQSREEIEERLANHHLCFAARENGRMVQACWIAPDGAWIDYLDWELPLAPEEIYIYDMWAGPSDRGRYLFRAQMSAMYDYFAAYENKVRAFPHHVGPPHLPYGFVCAFHVENRIWTLFARAGMRPREIVGYVGVGPLRWRFRRPAPPEEELRRKSRRMSKARRRAAAG
jgi:hypothetical protein